MRKRGLKEIQRKGLLDMIFVLIALGLPFILVFAYDTTINVIGLEKDEWAKYKDDIDSYSVEEAREVDKEDVVVESGMVTVPSYIGEGGIKVKETIKIPVEEINLNKYEESNILTLEFREVKEEVKDKGLLNLVEEEIGEEYMYRDKFDFSLRN